ATRRIGLALTLSTTFYPPFLLARLLTTLDHLSRGRIAWNVVTSYKHEEVLNFDYQELLDHDQRYDRAEEYLALCAQLWASWAPDAVVMDPHTNTFADPAKGRANEKKNASALIRLYAYTTIPTVQTSPEGSMARLRSARYCRAA